MTRLFFYLSIVGFCTLSACIGGDGALFDRIRGEGPITESTYTFERFSAVHLHCAGNAYLREGNDPSVRAVGQRNILDALKMEVENSVLHLRLRPGSYNYEKLEFHVSMPSLDRAVVSGSGSISAERTFPEVDRLELRVSGSGEIELPIDAQQVDAKVSGSGDIELSGRTQDFFTTVTGSGDISAYRLEAETVEASVSGSGDIQVKANKHLKARVSGSGDVEYRGNPTVDAKISGSGDVEKG